MESRPQIDIKNIPIWLGKYLPGFAVAFSILAIIIFALFHRIDLALGGLYLFVCIALAGIVSLTAPKLFKLKIEDNRSKSHRDVVIRFSKLTLIFILLYVVSLCFLTIFDNRPLLYFILIAVMSGILILEIQSTQVDRYTGIILFQIGFLLLNLSFGQTLKLPFYFGDTDIFGHIYNINTILDSGHTSSLIGGYLHFPNFHILNAEGVMLTGMGIRMSYFVVNGLMVATTIPIIYLLVKKITQNISLALMATLIYTLSGQIIFYDMYTLTRTIAYVFSILIIYLLVIQKKDSVHKILALLLIPPLVLTHQTTLVILSGILLLIIVLDLVIHHHLARFNLIYTFLLTAAYLSYWFFIARDFFDQITYVLFFTEQTIPLPGGGQERLPWQFNFAANTDYFVIGFLALLGITGLLRWKNKNNETCYIFVLMALISLFFFLPGPADYLLPIAAAYRIPIMVAPFVAMAAGAALWFMLQQWKNGVGPIRIWSVAGVCLILAYSFISPVLLSGQTDRDLSNLVGPQNRKYFSGAELSAFSYLIGHKTDVQIYSDLISYQYLRNYLGTQITCNLSTLQVNCSRFFVFREEEYYTRKQLPFLDIQPGIRDSVIDYALNANQNPIPTWTTGNRIYCDRAIVIFYKY